MLSNYTTEKPIPTPDLQIILNRDTPSVHPIHQEIIQATGGSDVRRQETVLQQLLKEVERPTIPTCDKIAAIVKAHPPFAPEAIKSLLNIDGRCKPTAGQNCIAALIKKLVDTYPTQATHAILKPGLMSLKIYVIGNAYVGIKHLFEVAPSFKTTIYVACSRRLLRGYLSNSNYCIRWQTLRFKIRH